MDTDVERCTQYRPTFQRSSVEKRWRKSDTVRYVLPENNAQFALLA